MENKYEKIIKSLGFAVATLVQKKTVELFEQRKSAIILSPTGTGKTHAYLLPLIENIDVTLKEVQGLIIVPTNELVEQVGMMLKPLASDITYKLIRARDDKKRLIASLNYEQPQIVIATPGRLRDLTVKENVLRVHALKYLIIDEADMLFDFDFMSQLDLVISRIDSLVYVFSATMPKNLLSWINKYFKTVELLDLNAEIKLNIDHYLIAEGLDKEHRLLKLLAAINPYLCLIFVSKNEEVETVYKLLIENGYNATRISSDVPIRERKTVINEIRELKYQYIVASDLAARGLDFVGISQIINYDLPKKIEFYIHRSGRTGRMGAHGEVYSFYENADSRKIEQLEKRKIEFTKVKINNTIIEKEKKSSKGLTEAETAIIRKIKKPTKVKPGYKKKNKRKIETALKKARWKGKK